MLTEARTTLKNNTPSSPRAWKQCVRKPQGGSWILRWNPSSNTCGALDLITNACTFFVICTLKKNKNKKAHHPARGLIGGAWGSHGVTCTSRLNPFSDSYGVLDLINHISCMCFLSHMHAKYTVPHHKHLQLSHSISLSDPRMMPQNSRRGTDKIGRDGRVVVKLPWGTTQNTYLIKLLFFFSHQILVSLLFPEPPSSFWKESI